MKTLSQAVLFALITFAATPSFALVKKVDQCQTSNGQYLIFIGDNQGTGPVRTSQLYATISNRQGQQLASYLIEWKPGVRSASFGRAELIDSQSKGKIFDLAYPSTNFRYTTFLAVINGKKVSDDNLKCGR